MPEPIRHDLDGWTVEYRTGRDVNGAIVITRLTIRPAGRVVPAKGITAAVLDRVPTGAYVTTRTWADVRHSGTTWADIAREGTGADLSQETRTNTAPRGRGKKHDPRFLAEVAQRYLQLVESHSADVIGELQAALHAQGHDYRPNGVRELIRKAREQKLLEGTIAGKAGGRLTAEARRLLAEGDD